MILLDKVRNETSSNKVRSRFVAPIDLQSGEDKSMVKKGRGVAVSVGVTDSSPKFDFTEDVLRAADMRVFIGRKMFLDHPNSKFSQEGPSVRDEAGIITNAFFDDAQRGIVVEFDIIDPEFGRKLALKSAQGHTESTFLSISALLTFAHNEETGVNQVFGIQAIASVDFVWMPGSPGSRVTEVMFAATDQKTDPSTIGLEDFLSLRPEYRDYIRPEMLEKTNGNTPAQTGIDMSLGAIKPIKSLLG